MPSVNVRNITRSRTGQRVFSVRFDVEVDGVAVTRDLTFPDDLVTWAQQGFYTADELAERIYEVCLWAAKRRAGLTE